MQILQTATERSYHIKKDDFFVNFHITENIDSKFKTVRIEIRNMNKTFADFILHDKELDEVIELINEYKNIK